MESCSSMINAFCSGVLKSDKPGPSEGHGLGVTGVGNTGTRNGDDDGNAVCVGKEGNDGNDEKDGNAENDGKTNDENDGKGGYVDIEVKVG